MNTLPAQEIKRRGVKAIELALKNGPVHIIKNNTPTCVVLTESEYAKLSTPSKSDTVKQNTLTQWLLHKKSSGHKSKEQLDAQLTAERANWDK